MVMTVATQVFSTAVLVSSLFFCNLGEARSIKPTYDFRKIELTGGIEITDIKEGLKGFDFDLQPIADVSQVESVLEDYLGSSDERIVGKVYETVRSPLRFYVFFSVNTLDESKRLYTLMLNQQGSVLAAIDYDVVSVSDDLMIVENGSDEDLVTYEVRRRDQGSLFSGSGPY